MTEHDTPENLLDGPAPSIDVIVEEVDRLNGVVSQFLEYARPLQGNPIAMDVNNVVSATLRHLGRGTTFTLRLPAG